MEREQVNADRELIPSLLSRPEFREFLDGRDIKPEDIPLIEKLTAFPKELIIMELHNVFNLYHERSGQELANMIATTGDTSRKALYEAMQQFHERYGWATSWNLVRVLESVK